MIVTKTRDEGLLERFRSGESPQQIASDVGISRQRFYVILKKLAKAIGVRNVSKLRPKPVKIKEVKVKPPGKTIHQAAALLDISPQCLKQLCWKGRVPFAIKTDQWYLPPKSLAFISRFPESRGALGQSIAADMRAEAVRLDPSCAVRQEAYSAAHPPGSWPQTARPKHRKLLKRDAPKNLRELWNRTASSDKTMRVAQLCAAISEQEGGGWFVLSIADLARIAGESRTWASSVLELLQETGKLRQREWRLKWIG